MAPHTAETRNTYYQRLAGLDMLKREAARVAALPDPSAAMLGLHLLAKRHGIQTGPPAAIRARALQAIDRELDRWPGRRKRAST
jgi:hypothetical protein